MALLLIYLVVGFVGRGETILVPSWEQSITQMLYNTYVRGQPSTFVTPVTQVVPVPTRTIVATPPSNVVYNTGDSIVINNNYYGQQPPGYPPTYPTPAYPAYPAPQYPAPGYPTPIYQPAPNYPPQIYPTNIYPTYMQPQPQPQYQPQPSLPVSSQPVSPNQQITTNILNTIMGGLVGRTVAPSNPVYGSDYQVRSFNISINSDLGGTTTAQPTQPAQTTQPSQPIIPTVPIQPTQPTQPVQPVQNTQPAQPTQPQTNQPIIPLPPKPITNTTTPPAPITNTNTTPTTATTTTTTPIAATNTTTTNITTTNTTTIPQTTQQPPTPMASASPIKTTYQDYRLQFDPANFREREPDTPQMLFYREAVYRDNLIAINDHNAQPNQPYLMGLNIFTDLTPDQFRLKYLKFLPNEEEKSNNLGVQFNMKQKPEGIIIYKTPAPIKIDWSCRGDPPIFQGICSASTIIAPLDSIQLTAKAHGQNIRYLSIQEVLSCASTSNGCANNSMDFVFEYILQQGVGQSRQYYYDDPAKLEGVVSECSRGIIDSTQYKNSRFFIKAYRKIEFLDCTEVVNQLKVRTLAVGIAGAGLQFYASGTYHLYDQYVNHAVVLVGYSPQRGYKIKNSWSTLWGEKGYGYVSEKAGVCNYAMYAILKQEIQSPISCSPQQLKTM